MQEIVYDSPLYGECVLYKVGEYQDGSTCLRVEQDGVDLATLTVALVDTKLEPGEFLIKTWSENKRLTDELLELGIFKDTGKRRDIGYVEASIWRLSNENQN